MNIIIQPYLLVFPIIVVIAQDTGSWGCAKVFQYPKGEDLNQHLDVGWLEAELSRSSF